MRAKAKKGTDEDVDRFRSELLSKHGSGISVGFDHVAQALAVNGEAAFSERSGFLLNVLDLQPDAEVDGDAEPDDNKVGDGENSEEPSPKKRKVWIDRDRLISSTIRAVKLQHAAFSAKASEQLNKQKTFLKTFDRDTPHEVKEQFSGEVATLRVRVEGLATVLENEDEAAVKQFMTGFNP